MSYRILLPTAGTGSRLGSLTRYVNKSLVSVANRPVLSHLLEQFPANAEFVIALGHKGELVRDFLEMAYPDRVFHYGWVDPFEGPGSGLGLSIQCCKEHLQEPIVFCSCDTLTDTPIPAPDKHWMGYANVDDIRPYRTLKVSDGVVTDICEKGMDAPDLKAYIGLAGIHDHDRFWDTMNSGGDTAIAQGEAYGLRALLDTTIQAHSFTWMDTGNPEALARAREIKRQPNEPNILDKPNEAIWFIDGTVIKFSADTEFIANRVKRTEFIKGFCPPVINANDHMYQYSMVEGEVLSDAISLPLFEQFLEFSHSFWEPHALQEDELASFKSTCMNFYKTKTLKRVDQFYSTFDKSDGTEPIN